MILFDILINYSLTSEMEFMPLIVLETDLKLMAHLLPLTSSAEKRQGSVSLSGIKFLSVFHSCSECTRSGLSMGH